MPQEPFGAFDVSQYGISVAVVEPLQTDGCQAQMFEAHSDVKPIKDSLVRGR